MHAPSSMHIAYSSGSSARLPERIIGPATISFLFVVDTAWVWMLVVQNHPWTTTTTIIKKDTSNCTHFICSDTLFYGKQQHIVGCVKPISAAAPYCPSWPYKLLWPFVCLHTIQTYIYYSMDRLNNGQRRDAGGYIHNIMCLSRLTKIDGCLNDHRSTRAPSLSHFCLPYE